MKKDILFFVFLLFITGLFLGCTSKSKNNEKSIENTEAIQEEENTFQKIKDIINKGFSHSFKEEITYSETKLDLSLLSQEELKFYNEYVGVYLSKDEAKNIIRYRYSFTPIISQDEECKYTAVGTDYHTVFYSPENKCFYEGDGITVSKIDIKNYSGIKGYKKIDFDTIPPLTELNSDESKKENDIINLLSNFFEVLSNKEFENLVDNYYSVSDFKAIKRDLSVNQPSREELINDAEYLFDCFYAHNKPQALFINVYFSEDKKLIESNFGECYLIEFKYDISNYFSFTIKEINQEMKIVSYRNQLNMM